LLAGLSGVREHAEWYGPVRARLLRWRLVVRGLPDAELMVAAGPDLPDPTTDPDVLITRLPYVSKEQSGREEQLATLARLTRELAPGRTAVVLGPTDLLTGALPPYRPAFRIRKQLLADRPLTEVVNDLCWM